MRRAVLVLAALAATVVGLLAVGSGVASAALVPPHDDSIATETTNWIKQFTIPKFNTDLGRLDSVRIEYSATVAGNADFENLSRTATAKVTTTMSAKVALSLPGAVTPLSELAPTKTVMDDLTAFDGINDSDGDSGQTYALLTATVSFDQTFSTEDVLSLFRGTTGQTIALPVVATGQSTIVTDGGSLDSFVETQAGGAIKVTYTYTPPSVDIEKSTNGADADTPTGPFIAVDAPVTWTYVVTNNGSMPLKEIGVTDDKGVIPVCDAHADPLPPGGSFSCSATAPAVAGQYSNIGSVIAKPVNGTTTLTTTVTDSDPSHYFGYRGAIDIEKATNGEDADTPPGPSITVGKPVVWTFVVTNTGNVPLKGVAVTDDKLGAIACPKAVLAVAEIMTCTVNGVAVEGAYANVGKAVGQPHDVLGDPSTALGVPVMDTDASHYTGKPIDCVAPKPKPKPKPTPKPGPWPSGKYSEYIVVDGTVYPVFSFLGKRYVLLRIYVYPVTVKDGKSIVRIGDEEYEVKKVERKLSNGNCIVKDDTPKPEDPPVVVPDTSGGTAGEQGTTGETPNEQAGQATGSGSTGSSPPTGSSTTTGVSCVGSPGYWFSGTGKDSGVWALLGKKGKQTPFFSSKRSYRAVLGSTSSKPYYVLARAYITAKLNALAGAGAKQRAVLSMGWAEKYFRSGGRTGTKKAVLRHARSLLDHDLPICS